MKWEGRYILSALKKSKENYTNKVLLNNISRIRILKDQEQTIL